MEKVAVNLSEVSRRGLMTILGTAAASFHTAVQLADAVAVLGPVLLGVDFERLDELR